MKTCVGYTIYSKMDMVCWLLDGIVRNFDPATTELGFCFDACQDGTVEHFREVKDFWLLRRGFKVHEIVHPGPEECREIGGHNRLLDWFMNHTDAQMLIAPQDDQHLNRPIVPDLERLMGTYGERLGVIGGRDGYNQCFHNMAGSQWSESTCQIRLAPGEFMERPFLNSGPVIYPRHVVQKVGILDGNFNSYYIWDDYGARCRNAGFTNGVLGTDLIHAKFGRIKNTWWAVTGEYSARDMAYLKSKHQGVM